MQRLAARSPRDETFETPLRLYAPSEDAQQKLKVAFFVAAPLWGGAEQQAYLLVRGLRARGHTVEIFGRRDSPFAERLADDGFVVHTSAATGRAPWSVWQIRRRLRDFQPDVVHFNDPHALTSGGLASLGLPIPARIAHRRSSFPIRNVARYRRFADRVICVADGVAQICQGSGVESNRIRVVRSGSDPTVIGAGNGAHARRELGVGDDEHLLLTVGLLNEVKGHSYLLKAMQRIVRKIDSVRLALAGDGPLEQQLRAEAQQLGLSDRIMFLGFRHDVPDLLQAADLFVVPSVQEGICGVLIEAMLAATPIVSTSVGGIPEILGPSEDGRKSAWLVPARSVDSLTGAVLEAIGSEEQRIERSRRAQNNALTSLTHDHTVENTLAVYREVLSDTLESSDVLPLPQVGSDHERQAA